MLFVLSPAKTLDYETPVPAKVAHTLPQFAAQAAELIEVLRAQTPQQIASLMKLSDKLAGLNVARYQAWSPRATAENARQAVFAFNGEVYDGLDARSLGTADLQWAQTHVVILSGLYGVLRPLDWMQPYRLEMGTALATARGANLYQFWGDRIGRCLQQQLTLPEHAMPTGSVLVNLASREYFKSVSTEAFHARLVECVFEDYKGGKYKIISFFAKRARGLMARFAIENRVAHVEQLQAFAADGYAYVAAASEPRRLVFRRRQGL